MWNFDKNPELSLYRLKFLWMIYFQCWGVPMVFGMNDQKDNVNVHFYINSDAWASECILLI